MLFEKFTRFPNKKAFKTARLVNKFFLDFLLFSLIFRCF
jgi:hypothetical protein